MTFIVVAAHGSGLIFTSPICYDGRNDDNDI
jgi:hypothetical protein